MSSLALARAAAVRPRRAVTAAALFALAGCGPCPRVADAWAQRLRAELAEAGSGVVVDSGTPDHMLVVLDGKALALVLTSLPSDAWFSPEGAQLDAGDAGERRGEPRAVVSIEVIPRVTAAALVPDGAPATVLDVESIVVVDFDAIDRPTSTLTTTARTQLRAEVRFLDLDGVPTLALELPDPASLSLASTLPTIPADYPEFTAQALEDLIHQLILVAIRGGVGMRPVLRWEPPGLPSGLLRSAPSSLSRTPDGRGLVLGIATNLRPSGGGPRAVSPDAAVVVHPDLLRAALVGGHTAARLPRAFDPAGDPDPDGAVRVSVLSAGVVGTEISARVARYCLAPPRCAVEQSTITASLRGAAAQAVRPADPPLAAAQGAAEATIAALLAPPVLRLESGGFLFLAAESASGSALGVELRGHFEPATTPLGER